MRKATDQRRRAEEGLEGSFNEMTIEMQIGRIGDHCLNGDRPVKRQANGYLSLIV